MSSKATNGTTQMRNNTLNQQGSSTGYNTIISFESDEDFEKSKVSYDIPAICTAYRRFLALEAKSTVTNTIGQQESSVVKGRFYERFNQLLDRLFGNDTISKQKYGGWIDYSIGFASLVTTPSIHSNANRPVRTTAFTLIGTEGAENSVTSLTSNGKAILQFLSVHAEDDGAMFPFLFRTDHPVEFKLDLDMLPEQSKMSILGRSPHTSALFTQIMKKPLMKQVLDLRNPQLLVTIKELYLFYFLRHPTSASPKGSPSSGTSTSSTNSSTGAQGKSLMRTFSDISNMSSFGSKSRGKDDYTWRSFHKDGILSLTRGNPYNCLLLQYIRFFLPDTNLAVQSRFHAKVLKESSLFLHILIEFWLRQNLIIFSDDPNVNIQQQSSEQGVTPPPQHPTITTTPFATVHTYTTYMAPSDDLLCSILISIIESLSDSFYPAALPQSKSKAVTVNVNAFLTPTTIVMRRPLYHFFRLVFSRTPIALSPMSFLAVIDVWSAYLQPWCCKSWARGKDPSKSTQNPPTNINNSGQQPTLLDLEKKPEVPQNEFTKAYTGFVLANYHFYTVLLGVFVERSKELDFSKMDERSLNVLDRVLDIYNPDLLEVLRKASVYLSSQTISDDQQYFPSYDSTQASITRFRKDKNKQNSSGGITSVTTDEKQSLEKLSAIEIAVLTNGCQSLGLTLDAVDLNDTYHRDAERLFDKLWNDSGFFGISETNVNANTNNSASPPSSGRGTSFSTMLRTSFSSGSKEPYLEKVQRVSRQLRKVFQISDSYVISTTESHSLATGSQCNVSGLPIYDRILRHKLTRIGVEQLQKGIRMCTPTPDCAAYIGDPMLAPICSYEIPFLVRLMYRVSTWLNTQMGLPNPYRHPNDEGDFTNAFYENLEVDPAIVVKDFRFNFRFLASQPNLIWLSIFIGFVYTLHVW